MNYKRLLTFVAIAMIAMTSTGLAQEATEKSAKEGTFQFITTNPKVKEVFTTELLKKIEKNRDENEIVYLKIGTYTTAKILPVTTISKPDFTPLKELYTDK